MAKFLRFIFNRFTIITLLIFIQIGFMIYMNLYFSKIYTWVPILTTIIEVILILDLVNRDMTADLKLPWLAVIMLVPVAGIIIYFLFSKNRARKKDVVNYENIFQQLQKCISDLEIDSKVLNDYSGQSNYIKNTCNSGLFANSKTQYFKCGEDFFDEYIKDLENAKEFIFLEYFILEKGIMLNKILDILKRKVKEGVEVRLMYDDLGSITKLNRKFNKELISYGIKCVKFGPFIPIVTAVHNNRDHRKITIIDGYISYVGGINLADEYINLNKRFGYWKDSTLKIEGSATNQLTVFYLQLFNLVKHVDDDYDKYFKVYSNTTSVNGYIQPFCDGPNPMFPELIGENVYLNLINQAKESIYITTPYLIIDSLLKNALIAASKRGVSVNICMPHIPDKKIIFILSRSNYEDLLKNNINIYEFKEGFLHSKNFLVDNELAVVGTINLDYRSLVHHYECGVLMFNTDSISDIKADFDEIINNSININLNNFKMKWYEKIIHRLISIFSPML